MFKIIGYSTIGVAVFSLLVLCTFLGLGLSFHSFCIWYSGLAGGFLVFFIFSYILKRLI